MTLLHRWYINQAWNNTIFGVLKHKYSELELEILKYKYFKNVFKYIINTNTIVYIPSLILTDLVRDAENG